MFSNRYSVVFPLSDRFAYRDPAAYIKDGTVYLFFSLVENAPDGQFFYLAESTSTDFVNWTKPVILSPRDLDINISSPGNVIFHDGYYYLSVQTYPRPNGEKYGNEKSRVFTMKSKDLMNWEEPVMLMVKGDIPVEQMGRMIDPYILEDDGTFYCFYKQNGVSFSTSKDLINWEFKGNTACGENVCVLKENDEFYIIHSPKNGIGLLKTKDLKEFTDCGVTYLGQEEWPWAKDRITAGFVYDLTGTGYGHRYCMFFHGDDFDSHFFDASLAVVFFDQLDELWPDIRK